MDHIGMDGGMVNSHVCELTEAGEVVERQIRTERRRLKTCSVTDRRLAS
jgi:hypothetical protein